MQVVILSKKEEKKEKLLREVIVKIGLKQEDNKDGITMKTLLNSGATGLVMSPEFIKKNKFKKKKLERPIYIRNVDNTLNYKRLIEYTVEIELFYRGHKKRIKIDVIEGQKCSIMLEISWLAHYNPEID